MEKEKVIQLIQCGSRIETQIGKIEAIITGINIRGERVTYEISYFSNGEYKNTWLDVSEFIVIDEGNMVTVGFKRFSL